MSQSAQFEMLLMLAQTAWGMVDAADLARYGGDPYLAILHRSWGYTLTMRPDEGGPVYFAAVFRDDRDAAKSYHSRSPVAALGEAYVAALRRERAGRLN